ncbi:acyltransferase [Jatrophihabitans sp. YIM 134969]
MTEPAATTRPKRRAHVHEIDVVRVLTFASVIAVHTVANVNAGDLVWPNAVLMMLHFTRSAFFALTGFVLTYQYLGRPVQTRNFWRRRLTLVGVPYVTWSVLYTALDQVDHPAASLGAFVQKLLFNIGVGDAWYHLYFLLVSMQIYLLFPLIQWLVEKTRGHHLALLVASAVLQFGVLSAIRYGNPGPGWASNIVTYSDTIFVSYQFYVLAGAVAATRLDEIRAWVPAHTRGILLTVVGTAVLTEAFFALEVATGMGAQRAATVLQPAMFPWSIVATAGLLSLGVLWSRSHAADSTQARWLRTASDRSFGVFLVHPAVLWFLLWLASDRLADVLTGPGATVLAYLVVVVGAVGFTELARHTPVSMPLTGRPSLAEVERAEVAKRSGPRASAEPAAPSPPAPVTDRAER